MIVSLSLKNLRRNLKLSLIVFSLFALLIAVFYIGNALIAESSEGLKKSYRQNFTADLVLKAPTTRDVSLFGPLTPSIGEFYTLPALKNRDEILSVLNFQTEVKQTAGLSFGASVMDIQGQRYTKPVFGIEGTGYFELFPGLHIKQGEGIKDGEPGVMISEATYQRIFEESGSYPVMGERVLLSMGGKRGFKIRDLPLKGVFQYDVRDPVLDEIVLCDMQTLQVLNSLALASDPTDIEPDESDLFTENMDDLFGEDLFRDDASDTSHTVTVDSVTGIRDGQIPSLFEGGGWHFILIRLKEGVSAPSYTKKLTRLLAREGLEAEVMSWKDAAGLSARLVFLLQGLYNAGFLLVLLAGGIAIVNILLIAVFDRTSEIGTLRAIGARKSFIFRLVLVENLVLAGIGGAAGIVLALIFFKLINRMEISIGNMILKTLLGGDTLSVSPHLFWALNSLIVSIILGGLSSWFPIHKALGISPTVAQGKE